MRSALDFLKSPLAVVCHDAGAANLIIGWLSNLRDLTIHAHMQGPALKLWQAAFPESTLFPLKEALQGSVQLLSGTGWESSLEYEARRLACEQSIPSIAVIDHWTNYEDRFIRNGKQLLPAEIWVSDAYAAEIAQSAFPNVRVIQQANSYLSGMVAEVESLQSREGAVGGNDRVLYVLEPIRHVWGELAEPGEFLALDYFMAQRHRAGIDLDAEIRLRPHPSEPPAKYNSWLTRQTSSKVSLDLSASLAHALSWSNVVVGCQTYAMVLALACGRTVISSVPPWAPISNLPQLDIKHLSRLPL